MSASRERIGDVHFPFEGTCVKHSIERLARLRLVCIQLDRPIRRKDFPNVTIVAKLTGDAVMEAS